MKLAQDISLLPFNTFGIQAQAEYYREVTTVDELRDVLRLRKQPVFVLGGGSNVLFTGDMKGLVIRNAIEGTVVTRRFKNKVWVKAGGGTVWHDFVQWAVSSGLGGVENLSLIPGTVGAAPVQNIGAYGVELKDVFVELYALELETGKLRYFNKTDCQFGYRDSFFKREGKGKYCIVSVVFSLTQHRHRINISYGDIRKVLDAAGISTPAIGDISRAVIQIRSSKLPDPAKIGNCGSFFKNPEVERAVLERIKAAYPTVPHFDVPDKNRVKIPAGWLIEQCGWKGKRVGNTGCYEKQALVLVNYGGATGAEVRHLAFEIIDSVERRFGVRLEPEVSIL